MQAVTQPQRHGSRQRNMVWAILVSLVVTSGGAWGQTTSTNPPSLLAAEVPDWVLNAPTEPPRLLRHHFWDPDTDETLLRARRVRPTAGQRWSDFERKYGITDPSDSFVLGAIQTAKYQLDKTVFALDLFVEQTRDALRFEYDFARGILIRGRQEPEDNMQPSTSTWWGPSFGEARLRTDVDLDVASGRAWVGLRLVVPVGP